MRPSYLYATDSYPGHPHTVVHGRSRYKAVEANVQEATERGLWLVA